MDLWDLTLVKFTGSGYFFFFKTCSKVFWANATKSKKDHMIYKVHKNRNIVYVGCAFKIKLLSESCDKASTPPEDTSNAFFPTP